MNQSIKESSAAITLSINEERKRFKELIGYQSPGILSFTCVHQEQTNWCWAGVTKAINDFKGGNATQCQIASRTLERTDCCAQPGNCNTPYYLDMALSAYNLLRVVANGKYGYADVQTEINTERPVALRLGWNGGGGHFITIYGYSDPQHIVICDPWYGTSIQNYGSFPDAYQGGAAWTHTYLTT